jgi:hypothetical protein
MKGKKKKKKKKKSQFKKGGNGVPKTPKKAKG